MTEAKRKKIGRGLFVTWQGLVLLGLAVIYMAITNEKDYREGESKFRAETNFNHSQDSSKWVAQQNLNSQLFKEIGAVRRRLKIEQ